VKEDEGFTLIEVLVSMAVLGMTLGLIIVLFGKGLRTVALTEGYSQALLLAGERMDDGTRFTGLDPDLEEGRVHRSRDYHWERRRTLLFPDKRPTNENLENPKPRLYRVEVKVQWREGRKERELTLESVAMSMTQADEAGK